jgi:hypothetical protein
MTMTGPHYPDQLNRPSPNDQPESETAADQATTPASPALGTLPPGVHPLDPSVPADRVNEGDLVVPQDSTLPKYETKRKPWSTDNTEALPVYQRSATDWGSGVVIPNVNFNSGTATVVGRQKGRIAVKVWVPTKTADGNTVTNGVLIGPNESELQNPNALDNVVLNVGDSITLETEGSVYCAVIPGQTTGVCQYVSLNNPLGGPVGGD